MEIKKSNFVLDSLLLILTVFILVTAVDGQKNVLMIVSDDMRPQLGAYLGPDYPSNVDHQILTPNIDALSSKSLVLTRGYVQQAICSPSRASYMTSRRPDTTHVYNLEDYWREVGGNFTTIPQYFKENGYRTFGLGKIYHYDGPATGGDNDGYSWTEPYYMPPGLEIWVTKNSSWLAATSANLEEYGPLPDEQVAQQAIQVLQDVAPGAIAGQEHFFIGLGFYLPHLPFIFPEEILDQYPRGNISIPSNHYAPVNMPEIAWFDYSGLRLYDDIAALNLTGEINTTLPDDLVIDLRRAYYSSITYVDHLIGRVLSALSDLGLANDTIVTFNSDHGWSLGENAEWTKMTNFEQALHAPMMIHIPGVTDSGIKTNALVEFVDLFPTIIEAAGFSSLLPCPEESSNIILCTEGMSMLPLIEDPPGPWKDRAFSQYPRNNLAQMGYSLRTDQYRYTEWVNFLGDPVYEPDWSILHGVELYDHQIDPLENYNFADDTEYLAVREQLSELLREGWRAAVPSK